MSSVYRNNNGESGSRTPAAVSLLHLLVRAGQYRAMLYEV